MNAEPGGAGCRVLARVLRDLVPQIGALVRALGAARPDGCGREWVERAGLVHRVLVRELADLEVLITATDHAPDHAEADRDGRSGPDGSDPADHPDPEPGPPAPALAARTARTARTGRARLGAVTGERVGPGFGPRIATLADEPS